jgi:hypothetical protein
MTFELAELYSRNSFESYHFGRHTFSDKLRFTALLVTSGQDGRSGMLTADILIVYTVTDLITELSGNRSVNTFHYAIIGRMFIARC